MIYHHYDSALGQVLGTCSLACPFSRLFFSPVLHEIPSGHPWCLQAMIFSTSPPHRTGLRVVFTFRTILSWGSIFSDVGLLVLTQLTITIAFYDLRRCSGSILSSPIP